MGGYNITHFSEQAGVVHSGYPWPALTQAAFSNAWGRGEHAIVNWSGHGLPDGSYRVVWTWDDGDGVPEAADGELQAQRFVGLGDSGMDDDHPSIVFAISCDVGYPEPNPYGNCGIDLLTLPGWGASVGIVSSSRPSAISEDWKSSSGGTEQICFDFNRCLIVEGEKVGDALYDGKFHATTYYGWDLLYEYMNLHNFNLYGDPSMEIDRATSDLIASGAIDLPNLDLLPCVPNPFALSTSVRLRVGKAGPAHVSVHEVTGREVAVLLDRWLAAGEHSVVWDGSAGGAALPSGVYLVSVRKGGVRASSRVVLLHP